MRTREEKSAAWIDPEIRPLLDAARDRMTARPRADEIPIADLRRRTREDLERWNDDCLRNVRVEDLNVDSRWGPRLLRVVRPAGEHAGERIIVWLHGGGFVVGDADTHLGLATDLARAARIPVVLPEYVLAPEHPYPEPVDCSGELIDSALGSLGATAFSLGGDSAGAALAVAACTARRDTDRPLPRSLALVYGAFAPRFVTPSHCYFGADFGLTSDAMRFFWRAYLSGRDTGGSDLLSADLGRMPPTYLVAAGLDPLLDDSIDLAARLFRCGTAVRLDCVPGVIHGFIHMSREVAAARSAIAEIAQWLTADRHPGP